MVEARNEQPIHCKRMPPLLVAAVTICLFTTVGCGAVTGSSSAVAPPPVPTAGTYRLTYERSDAPTSTGLMEVVDNGATYTITTQTPAETQRTTFSADRNASHFVSSLIAIDGQATAICRPSSSSGHMTFKPDATETYTAKCDQGNNEAILLVTETDQFVGTDNITVAGKSRSAIELRVHQVNQVTNTSLAKTPGSFMQSVDSTEWIDTASGLVLMSDTKNNVPGKSYTERTVIESIQPDASAHLCPHYSAPTSLTVGKEFALGGGGWKPGSTVIIALTPSEVSLGNAPVDSCGWVEATPTVPSSAPLGKVQIEVIGTTAAGEAGNEMTPALTITSN